MKLIEYLMIWPNSISRMSETFNFKPKFSLNRPLEAINIYKRMDNFSKCQFMLMPYWNKSKLNLGTILFSRTVETIKSMIFISSYLQLQGKTESQKSKSYTASYFLTIFWRRVIGPFFCQKTVRHYVYIWFSRETVKVWVVC